MSTSHDPYTGRTRGRYLADLADEYGIPVQTVLALAYVLGPSEDFDGLVTHCQDMADEMAWTDFRLLHRLDDGGEP